MCENTEFKTFKLKKACKDCPFRKDKSYLSPESIRDRINDVIKHDRSFICHKTILYSNYQPLQQEVDDYIEELKHDGVSDEDLKLARLELEKEYNLSELKQEYEASLKDQMYCAGMLILVKKENMLGNNRALRYAIGEKLFNPDQFIDEHEVYDSIEDAIKGHS